MVVRTTGNGREHSSLWNATCNLALVVSCLPSVTLSQEPDAQGPLLVPPGQHTDPEQVPNTPEVRDRLLDTIDALASDKDVSTYQKAKHHWELLGEPIDDYVRLLRAAKNVSADELYKAGRIAYAPVNFTNHYQWEYPEGEVVHFINHRILALHEVVIEKGLLFQSDSESETSRVRAVVKKLRGDLFWSSAHKYEGVLERAAEILDNAFLSESEDGRFSLIDLYESLESGRTDNPIMMRLLERNVDQISPLFVFPENISHLTPPEQADALTVLLPIYNRIAKTVEATKDTSKLPPLRAARLQDWFAQTLTPAVYDHLIEMSLRIEILRASDHWSYNTETEKRYNDYTKSLGSLIHKATERNPDLTKRFLSQIETLLERNETGTIERIRLYRFLAHFSLAHDTKKHLCDFITKRIVQEKDALALSDGLGNTTALLYLRYHLEQRELFEQRRENILLNHDVEREQILEAMRARIDLRSTAEIKYRELSGFDGLLRDLISNSTLGYDFPTFRGDLPIKSREDVLGIAKIRTNCIHVANGVLTTLNHLAKREYGKGRNDDTLPRQIEFLGFGQTRWAGGAAVPNGSECSESLEQIAAIVKVSEQELTKIHGYGLTLESQAELIHIALRIFQTEHTNFQEGRIYREEKYKDLKKLFSRDYRTTHSVRERQGPFLENYKGARDYLYMKTFRNSAEFAELKDFKDHNKAESFDRTALRYADAHRDTVVLYLIRSLWQYSKDDGTSLLIRSGSHSSNIQTTFSLLHSLGLELVDISAESDFRKLCTDSTTREEFLLGLEKIHSVRNETRRKLRNEIMTREKDDEDNSKD